tara:strand:+ start:191 stop:586 length:396 start_codon:yes stop_codon:yes gene_type:complete
MSLTDPIGDMIARIRNGQMRFLENIQMPGSKLRENILKVLKEQGFISNYTVLSDKNKKNITVNLKYDHGSPVIKEIKRVSKPGRRIYSSANSIPKIQNGLGISIVSTSKGVMTDYEARKQNVGGEIICRVF